MSDYNLTEHGTHLSDHNVRQAFVAGDSAGDITVSGISHNDTLIAVYDLDTSASTPSASDVTDEFTIASDNTINNDDGTDTSGDLLAVSYYKNHPNA